MSRIELQVAGRPLTLSNLEKVLWPDVGFTKGDLVRYYQAIAPALLPHIAGRPLTLARFPEGVGGPGFYQQNCPPGRPKWLLIASVRGRSGIVLRYCVVNDLAALTWIANLATIEVHPLLATVDRADAPTLLVFDLDPGPPATLLDCCRVALELRGELAAVGLESYPMTSGSKGLHVCVPLGGTHGFAEAKRFARAVARALAARLPHEVVDRPSKLERRGKVFVDWAQNDGGKSTVAPYSLRATRVPLVSTPLRWDEMEGALAARDARAIVFGPKQVLERVARDGDLFRPVIELAQRLPARL